MYLFHIGMEGIWFGLLFGHEPRLALAVELSATVLAFASTVVLARLSWRLFEKRLLVPGHRFRYERAPEADLAAGTSTSLSGTQ
jgi:hypothetical protein